MVIAGMIRSLKIFTEICVVSIVLFLLLQEVDTHQERMVIGLKELKPKLLLRLDLKWKTSKWSNYGGRSKYYPHC